MSNGLRIVVLGEMGKIPFPGMAWEILQYLEGFRRLVHAFGRQVFHVPAGLLRGGEQQARDLLSPGDGFDQTVVGLAVELESAIFHNNSAIST